MKPATHPRIHGASVGLTHGQNLVPVPTPIEYPHPRIKLPSLGVEAEGPMAAVQPCGEVFKS
jgi:hypothetical protein